MHVFMDDWNQGGSKTRQATAMAKYLNELFPKQGPSL